MRQLIMLGVVCLAAFSLVSAARAEDDERCKKVNGHFVLTGIPAPNDPMGRVLGSSTGDLKVCHFRVLTPARRRPWVCGSSARRIC